MQKEQRCAFEYATDTPRVGTELLDDLCVEVRGRGRHSSINSRSSRIGSSLSPALRKSVRLFLMALPATPAGRALLGVRTALGISSLLAPRLAGKAFLLEPEDNPQLPVIGRMWGIRNLSLAAGMYGSTGANRAQWWRLQVAVDVLDFLVIATEWRRGAVPPPAAALMGATALGATALGAMSVPGESTQQG